jgi:hypothetical protein
LAKANSCLGPVGGVRISLPKLIAAAFPHRYR